MSVYAYDLDGILLADIDYAELQPEFKHNELVRVRSMMEPIFIPKFPYYLITGRPIEELKFTQEWLDRYFKAVDKPLALFHSNGDWKKASIYKAEILNTNHDITVYFESNELQVNYINKLINRPGVTVVLWRDFIHEATKLMKEALSMFGIDK